MAYDTTEAVAKFLSGFQMKITNRERDTVAPDYYVKYSLTLSKGGKDFSTTFVSDGEPTVTQVFSALADDALTLRKYSTDEFVDKLYAQGVKPSAALRAYDSCKETNLWMQDELYLSGWEIEEISKTLSQFVSRYYMTDLLEDNSIAVSLDTMLKNGNQFSLDGGIPAWTVEGDDLAKVNDFLKKSCMEFCGSLPGDEKDEDGYSLTGEAKDATASRNGLSRNQMGIEEKAAECKEAATVLANGNAL